MATSLGRAVAEEVVSKEAVPSVGEAPTPGFATPGVLANFAARKVLLTDTDLNVAGFLANDDVRTCPLSSPSLLLTASGRDASVSDPPLLLGSAEFTRSSILLAVRWVEKSSEDPEVAMSFRDGE